MSGATCDVYVRLPHGIIVGAIDSGIAGFAMDSARLFLDHGLTENVPRGPIDAWLKQNAHLACVRRGDVRIFENERLARDSSRR